MIITVLTGFLFFSGAVSILAATGQLVVLNRRKENINLSVLFLCVGIILIQHGLLFTEEVHSASVIMSFHATMLYLFGPLLYLAYFIVVHPGKEFPEKLIKFFIPAILSLIPDFYFLIQPHEWKNSLLENFYSNKNVSEIILTKILLTGACLQIIIYLISLLIKIIPAWSPGEKSSILNITIIYSMSSIGATVFLLAGFISSSLTLIKITSTITGLCLICAYILGQRYPGFLQLLKIEVKERHYKKSLLNGIDTESICREMDSLMKNEKLYIDENITLKNLAERMGITLHQLSQLLNEKLNVNFYTFINKYRIEEARRMLTEEPDRSIITIAYAVGFNSKSSFYEAFSKFTGKTPYKFRKDSLSKHNIN